MDLVDQFRYLFRGREDIWGHVEGRCVKNDPLTRRHWENHLYGDGSLGIYPLVSGKVPWGCSDIDQGYEEGWPLACNLEAALDALGIVSWIEKTKGKGWHVWAFVEGWVEAEEMRNALLVAHQIAGVAPTEVNPKSVKGGKDGNGNYVNLPYAANWVPDDRRVMVEGLGDVVTLDEFVEIALENLAAPQTIRDAAALYKPPPKRHVEIGPSTNVALTELVGRLPGLAYEIFQNGPAPERDGKGAKDRSGTLMRFAHLMREAGVFTPAEALALLADADMRWGKHYDRGDADEYLPQIIEKAWSVSPPQS